MTLLWGLLCENTAHSEQAAQEAAAKPCQIPRGPGEMSTGSWGDVGQCARYSPERVRALCALNSFLSASKRILPAETGLASSGVLFDTCTRHLIFPAALRTWHFCRYVLFSLLLFVEMRNLRPRAELALG